MGCNCQKAKRQQVQFVLKMPDGRTTTHGTQRDAERINQRRGGTGTITRKA